MISRLLKNIGHFVEYSLFYRALLQKRPMFLGSPEDQVCEWVFTQYARVRKAPCISAKEPWMSAKEPYISAKRATSTTSTTTAYCAVLKWTYRKWKGAVDVRDVDLVLGHYYSMCTVGCTTSTTTTYCAVFDGTNQNWKGAAKHLMSWRWFSVGSPLCWFSDGSPLRGGYSQ